MVATCNGVSSSQFNRPSTSIHRRTVQRSDVILSLAISHHATSVDQFSENSNAVIRCRHAERRATVLVSEVHRSSSVQKQPHDLHEFVLRCNQQRARAFLVDRVHGHTRVEASLGSVSVAAFTRSEHLRIGVRGMRWR